MICLCLLACYVAAGLGQVTTCFGVELRNSAAGTKRLQVAIQDACVYIHTKSTTYFVKFDIGDDEYEYFISSREVAGGCPN